MKNITNSTIIHIALYTLADGVNTERVHKLFRMVENCVGPCEGLISVYTGFNNSSSKFAKGWDCGVIMTFDSLVSRDDFLVHDLHKEITIETSNGFYDNVVIFDTELKNA